MKHHYIINRFQFNSTITLYKNKSTVKLYKKVISKHK